jgi:SepF-like predicted cell division protein (DUF552 family)
MAKVETIDVTTSEGSDKFPQNTNDKLNLIETLAIQNIDNLKSYNTIADGAYEYDVANGKVIEEVVIEMAEAQAFDKTPKFVVKDPVCHPKYFNNYEQKQFQTTIRKDDLRSVLKEQDAEDVATKILDTLSQGEGNYDFVQTRNVIYNADFKNYAEILGNAETPKTPKSMKGVIYVLRDMYNHLKSNNSDLTSASYISATPAESIRIAVSSKLLNLIDVTELANVFNLSKEELFGKIVVIDTDDLTDHTNDYMAYVYDLKAIGKATRVYDYTQDIYGNARCSTHYLTVERAYFHNGLFKGAKIDCSNACNNALAELIG